MCCTHHRNIARLAEMQRYGEKNISAETKSKFRMARRCLKFPCTRINAVFSLPLVTIGNVLRLMHMHNDHMPGEGGTPKEVLLGTVG